MFTEDNSTSLFTKFLAILGLAFVVSFIVTIVKDVRKNTSSDIISDEGKAILSDEKKRKKLTAAIEHYHKTGNWDKLAEVAE
jgi:hypothetical protein